MEVLETERPVQVVMGVKHVAVVVIQHEVGVRVAGQVIAGHHVAPANPEAVELEPVDVARDVECVALRKADAQGGG